MEGLRGKTVGGSAGMTTLFAPGAPPTFSIDPSDCCQGEPHDQPNTRCHGQGVDQPTAPFWIMPHPMPLEIDTFLINYS